MYKQTPQAPLYEISINGDIRNIRTKRLITIGYNKNSRLVRLELKVFGKRKYKTLNVDKLLIQVFPELLPKGESIPSFNDYIVTSTGKIFSKKSATYLQPAVTKKGYLQVSLVDKDSKTYSRLIHRLVAEAYLPKIEGKEIVNHIDGNKQNNYVSNLEWCTIKENNEHAYSTGLNSSKLRKCKLKKGIADWVEYPSITEAALKTRLPVGEIGICTRKNENAEALNMGVSIKYNPYRVHGYIAKYVDTKVPLCEDSAKIQQECSKITGIGSKQCAVSKDGKSWQVFKSATDANDWLNTQVCKTSKYVDNLCRCAKKNTPGNTNKGINVIDNPYRYKGYIVKYL